VKAEEDCPQSRLKLLDRLIFRLQGATLTISPTDHGRLPKSGRFNEVSIDPASGSVPRVWKGICDGPLESFDGGDGNGDGGRHDRLRAL